MANPSTLATDTLEVWRQNLNTIGSNIGDPATITATDTANGTTDTYTITSFKSAINGLIANKVKRSGDTIAALTVTGALVGNTASFSGVIASTLATGTAPFTVASTTPVANLSIGGNAASATNVSGGTTGAIPYQSAANTTAFLSVGGANKVLGLNAANNGVEYKSISSSGGSVVITYPSAGVINIEASTTVPGSTTFAAGIQVGSTPNYTTIGTNGAIVTYGTASLTVASTSTFTGTTQFNNTLTIGSNAVVGTTAGALTATGAITGGSFSTSGTLSAGASTVTSLTNNGTTSFSTLTDVLVTSLTTTTTTAGQVIQALPIATYRSVEWIIQAVDATGLKYHSATVKAVHDGTTVNSVEYAAANTANGLCGTFATAITGGNLQLTVTPATTNITVFKVYAVATKV